MAVPYRTAGNGQPESHNGVGLGRYTEGYGSRSRLAGRRVAVRWANSRHEAAPGATGATTPQLLYDDLPLDEPDAPTTVLDPEDEEVVELAREIDAWEASR